MTRWPPWSFTDLVWQWHSLFKLLSYLVIVHSLTLIFTDNWFPYYVMALWVISAYELRHTNQLINQSFNQSIIQSINRSINQSFNQSIKLLEHVHWSPGNAALSSCFSYLPQTCQRSLHSILSDWIRGMYMFLPDQLGYNFTKSEIHETWCDHCSSKNNVTQNAVWLHRSWQQDYTRNDSPNSYLKELCFWGVQQKVANSDDQRGDGSKQSGQWDV